MLLRRVREHVSRQDWFAVSIDLVIVVLGVFLGMQVTNWNEVRAERSAAADYRSQIVDDLDANIADLAGRNAYYRAARRHALAALAALEDPAVPRGEPFLVDAYQASQVWLRPLTRTGYDEMVGAGLTSRIGNRDMRSRLNAYYTQIRQFDITALGMTSYRERLRRVMPYKVQDAIIQRCGDRVSVVAGGAQMAALPDECSLGLDAATITRAEARIDAGELIEDLTRHIADLDQKLAGFDRFARLALENRRLLEAQGRR